MVLRLLSLGILRQDAHELAALVDRWAENSGDEWTVKRLKALKLEFITTVLAPDVMPRKVPWVARHKDGTIAGPLRRFFVDPFYVAHPQVVLNAFQIYTTFIAREATEVQISKFIGSAEAPPVDLPQGLLNAVHESPVWERVDLLGFKPKVNMYWESYRSPVKRVPAIVGTKPETDIWSDLKFSANSYSIRSMYTHNWEAMNLAFPDDVLEAFSDGPPSHDWVGTISYLQEAGYKLRAVANPTRVLQHSLQPLKGLLEFILRTIPEDCTFNQEFGVEWCKDQLRRGKTLHSIDLSDATNLFPLELQLEVLEKIEFLIDDQDLRDSFREWRNIFRAAAIAPWRLPNGNTLRFSKGQPLGLGPSFFLFSLSHHIILYSLAGKRKYVILGDDIVISDRSIAEEYRKVMKEIGCVISQDKSISSNSLGEFASRLVTPTGVLRQWKWREITRTNVIDICRNIGPTFLQEVPKPMRKVIEALAPIPKELGGLGWNPKGIPLSTRIDNKVAEHLLSKEGWGVARWYRSCAADDFVRQAYHAREDLGDDKGGLVPDYFGTFDLPDIFASPLESECTWSLRYFKQFQERLRELGRPGPHLGETIIVPLDKKLPNGYIWWNSAPSPWRTETSGLYRVVSRLLRGDKPIVT